MSETFYDVLGVDDDATAEEIEAAYRERLKETHPDLSDDEDAGEATKQVIRARDVLLDGDERDRYDRLGHEAYVGEDDSGDVDDEDVSDAAAAAREAGWADGQADVTDRNSTGTTSRRHRADRHRREQRARERIRTDFGHAARDDAVGTDPTSTGSGSGDVAGAGSATDGGEAAHTRAYGGNRSPSWTSEDGFTVRQQRTPRDRVRSLLPTGPALMLLGLAFFLYPIMLFSSVFPAFPLPMNVFIGICTVFLIGYLQAFPEVGLIVFGTWSLLAPVVLIWAAMPWFSLVGILVLGGTWVPFGLSLLTVRLFEF